MQTENTHFLTTVYSIVKSLNLCESQYDFSRLCGRSVSWFSASKSQDLPFSTEVAMTLIMRLREHLSRPDLPKQSKDDAEYLSEILRSIVRSRLRKSDDQTMPRMTDYAK